MTASHWSISATFCFRVPSPPQIAFPKMGEPENQEFTNVCVSAYYTLEPDKAPRLFLTPPAIPMGYAGFKKL